MTICCPKCSSMAFKRNGFTRHGKQNHRCLECGRQFSLEPEVSYIIEVPSGKESLIETAQEERYGQNIPISL